MGGSVWASSLGGDDHWVGALSAVAAFVGQKPFRRGFPEELVDECLGFFIEDADDELFPFGEEVVANAVNPEELMGKSLHRVKENLRKGAHLSSERGVGIGTPGMITPHETTNLIASSGFMSM